MPFTPLGSRRAPPGAAAFLGAAAAATESTIEEATRHRPSRFSIESGYHPSETERQGSQQPFHRPVRGLWKTRQCAVITGLLGPCAMPGEDARGNLPSPTDERPHRN